MKIFKLQILISLLVTVFNSCTPDDEPIEQSGVYANGYFVINEGIFGSGNASLTYVGEDGTIVQNAYQAVNSEAIGDALQSVYLHGDNAYLVVNNSHKIIVVNRYTMEKIAVIEGDEVNNPRYFVSIGYTGYITNWGSPGDPSDDFIAVVDLLSNTISSTISVSEGPEDMLVVDDKIYINYQGGWSQNNQVDIFDTTSNTITNSLTVAYVPNSIVQDTSGDIWVLCAGKPFYADEETAGQLVHIKNETVFESFDFSETTEHPEHLVIDDDTLYYSLNGKIYNRKTELPEVIQEELDLNGFYWGMTAENGKLYTLDAGDYQSEGNLRVFDLKTNELIKTVTTGIIPNSVVFN